MMWTCINCNRVGDGFVNGLCTDCDPEAVWIHPTENGYRVTNTEHGPTVREVGERVVEVSANKTSAEPVGSLNKAIRLACSAHAGQVDKNCEPYIFHPLRVMLDLQTRGEFEWVLMAAVLHDIVEDTAATLEDIEPYGPVIVKLVDRLTRREGETHKDYILRIKGNPTATRIKLADLRDNMDIRRYSGEDGLYTRYAKAYGVLTNHPTKTVEK